MFFETNFVDGRMYTIITIDPICQEKDAHAM
jgi:hypothetical protein